MWADISELLENHEQFAAAFDEEANFCAGCTQIHKHTPTCLKYANLQDGGMAGQCRFKAPWPLVEMTAFTEDGVLKIRRSHVYVNRYNKAIAVGLRHNHDFAFILTQHRTLALVYYVTNYATKVEDPVWKRAAAAAGLLDVLGQEAAQEVHREGQAEDAHQASAGNSILANRTRQFLMRVANRVFTERPLSQVEVAAHLLGYDTEYSSNEAWTFLNVSVLYWDVFRRWHHLQRAAGTDDLEPAVDEKVLLEEAGQRVSLLQAYPHRGEILRDLSLYDYMSVVQVRRKSSDATGAREVEFDSSSPLAQRWVQVLRKPGKHAIVCLHGHLSMNFDEEDEAYHGR